MTSPGLDVVSAVRAGFESACPCCGQGPVHKPVIVSGLTASLRINQCRSSIKEATQIIQTELLQLFEKTRVRRKTARFLTSSCRSADVEVCLTVLHVETSRFEN